MKGREGGGRSGDPGRGSGAGPVGFSTPWVSDVDSDASDVVESELQLGYLPPPDGHDFAAAVRHWHAAGVEAGLFQDGAPGVPTLLLERDRLRRARLSGSRSRSRSRSRGRSRSESVPRRGGEEPATQPRVDEGLDEEGAQQGEESPSRRAFPSEEQAKGPSLPTAPEPQTWPAKVQASRMTFRRRLAQLVVDLTLKGWDLRMDTRLKIAIPMAVMVVFGLVSNTRAHADQFHCDDLRSRRLWVTAGSVSCEVASRINIAWMCFHTSMDVARLVLALFPQTLPLAIRWQPWLTVLQFMVVSYYHGIGIMTGLFTLLIPMKPPPQFDNKSSAIVFQWCASLVMMAIGCTLWINTGIHISPWVEWGMAFLTGLPYCVSLFWFCSVIPSYLDRLPANFQTCSDIDYAGAASAAIIYPATYLIFSKIFHGGVVSEVNTPNNGPVDKAEGLYKAAFGIVLCAVFYVVGMLMAMYTLLLPPEGRNLTLAESIILSPFARSLFIVVAAPMASMVMRSATQISQFSRDLILGEILPKDAALAVLGNVTRAELAGKKGSESDSATTSGAETNRVRQVSIDGRQQYAAVRYMKQVGRVAAVAVDVPELSRLLATHDVAACVDLAHKVDVLVDAILDRSRARRIESGSPSMVLAVVNAEGGVADPEEKGLIIAEALHLGLLDLSSDPSSASLLSQSRTLRCRAAVASCDAAVVVTGVKRPNLRVLGPIQAVQGILGTVTPGQLCVSARAFKMLGADIKAMAMPQSVFSKAKRSETVYTLPLAQGPTEPTVAKVVLARSMSGSFATSSQQTTSRIRVLPPMH